MADNRDPNNPLAFLQNPLPDPFGGGVINIPVLQGQGVAGQDVNVPVLQQYGVAGQGSGREDVNVPVMQGGNNPNIPVLQQYGVAGQGSGRDTVSIPTLNQALSGASGQAGGGSTAMTPGGGIRGFANQTAASPSPASSPSTPKTSGSAAALAQSSIDPKLVQQLIGAGYDESTAHDIATQYQTSQAHAKLDKNLQAFIQSGYQPTNAPASPTNAYADPLAMQLFFKTTIAPYLQQVGDSMRGTADQFGSVQNQLLKDVPVVPAYRAALQANVQNQQAGMTQLANAMQGAATVAPYYDHLLAQLNNTSSAQQAARAAYLRANATSDQSGLATVLAALKG